MVGVFADKISRIVFSLYSLCVFSLLNFSLTRIVTIIYSTILY